MIILSKCCQTRGATRVAISKLGIALTQNYRVPPSHFAAGNNMRNVLTQTVPRRNKTRYTLTSFSTLNADDPVGEATSVLMRRILAPRLGFLLWPGGFLNKQEPVGGGGFPGNACKRLGKRDHGETYLSSNVVMDVRAFLESAKYFVVGCAPCLPDANFAQIGGIRGAQRTRHNLGPEDIRCRQKYALCTNTTKTRQTGAAAGLTSPPPPPSLKVAAVICCCRTHQQLPA